MADTPQSVVELLLKIKSEKEELAAVKAQLAALNAEIGATQTATAAATAETVKWTPAWSGFRATVGKTAADFEPATAAMRAASVATQATALNVSQLERNLTLLTAGVTRTIPGTGALGSEINLLGRGVAGTSAQLGVLNTIMIGTGIAAALAFAAAIAKVAATGLEVTSTLQKVGESIAGTLTSESGLFGGGKAQQAAAQTIDYITQAAQRAQVPISQLAEGFEKVNPAATRANATLQQQVDIVAKLTANSGTFGLTQEKLITDVTQLFNGQARNNNVLAERLGLDKQQVETARENGTITELLTEQVNKYTEAHQESGDTIERAQQKVQAAFEQLAVAAAKPLVQPVTDALNNLAAAMNDPAFQSGVSAIVAGFERIVQIAGQVISAMQSVGKAIYGAIQAAIAFAQTVPLGEGEGSQGGPPVGGEPGGAGLEYGGAESYLGNLPSGRLLGVSPGLRAPVGGYPKGGGGKKGPSQDTKDAEAMRALMAEIADYQEQYNAGVEKNNVAHQLGLQTLQQTQAANFELGNQTLAAYTQEQQKLDQMKQRILDTSVAQGGLNDKESARLSQLDKEIAKLDIAKQKIQLQQQGDTWLGQWQSGLIKLGDQFTLTGTKASQFFGQTLNTGINAVSTGLTGLIFQTGNWQQAFVSAGEAIVNSLIKIALQQVAGQAIQRASNVAQIQQDASKSYTGVYASASGIPYIGWIIAPIAAAAAYAACIAEETFAEGGIVPGGYSRTDNRVALVRSGEGIITPEAVSAIGGPSAIHAINNMQFAAPRFANGGVVGVPNITLGGITSQSTQQNLHFGFFDDRQSLANWMRSRDGRKIVVDHVRSSANEIGIPQTIG
jgi:hypothetical protein